MAAPTDETWYALNRPAENILDAGMSMLLGFKIREHLDSGNMSYETALLVTDSLRLRNPSSQLRADIIEAFPELKKAG